MSIALMNEVWSFAGPVGSSRLVLLALADNANDQGVCWPSVHTIAIKAGMTERNAQNVLQELIQDGWVVRNIQAGPKGCNTYTLTLKTGQQRWESVKDQRVYKRRTKKTDVGVNLSSPPEPQFTGGVNLSSSNPPNLSSPEPPVKPPVNQRRSSAQVFQKHPPTPGQTRTADAAASMAIIPETESETTQVWRTCFPNERLNPKDPNIAAALAGVRAAVSDLDAWRAACERWRAEKLAGEKRHGRNFDGMLDYYAQEVARKAKRANEYAIAPETPRQTTPEAARAWLAAQGPPSQRKKAVG